MIYLLTLFSQRTPFFLLLLHLTFFSRLPKLLIFYCPYVRTFLYAMQSRYPYYNRLLGTVEAEEEKKIYSSKKKKIFVLGLVW